MSGLAVGRLDREVTIQTVTRSKGTSEVPIETWSTLDVEWMSMAAESRGRQGEEQFVGSQVSAPAFIRWRMHFREDMDPATVSVPADRRLVYAGRTYDIVRAELVGREDGIELVTLAKAG